MDRQIEPKRHPVQSRDEPCPECGGQCCPECGLHPAGCVYGGFSHGYWLIAEGCDRSHSENADAR
jgi:hypothetical protein